MFASLKSFLYRHRVIILCLGLLAVVLILRPDLTLAAADTASSAPKTSTEYLKLIQDKLSVVLQYLGIILWPILLMIGGLLDNDIIFGGGMEDRLLLVWTPIRNFVNIGFVLILLVIGLYNILGRSEGEYSLKQALPKFVMALIAINFSFLACRVVIDASNVLTGAVATLPVEFIKEDQLKPSEEFIKRFCQPEWDDKTSTSKMPAMCQSQSKLTKLAEDFFGVTVDDKDGKVTQKNLAFTMAMVMISQFKYVAPNVEDYTSFIINLINNSLLGLIYAISFVVLFFVLLARVVVLWTLTALSPLIGLFFILPQGIKSELSGEHDLQKTFIQHAIAPVGVVAAMSIGFIMNMALKGATVPAVFSIKLNELHPDLKAVDLENLHKVVINLATIAIVWTGVFAAASKTMAKVVTDGIKSTGEAIGKFAATAWQYLPVIPTQVAKQHGVSEEDIKKIPTFSALSQFAHGVPGAMNRRSAEQAQDWLTTVFGDKAKGSIYLSDFGRAVEAAEKKKGTWNEAADMYAKAIKGGADTTSAEFKGFSDRLLAGRRLPALNPRDYDTPEALKAALRSRRDTYDILGPSGATPDQVDKLFEEGAKNKKKPTQVDEDVEKDKEKFINVNQSVTDTKQAVDNLVELTPETGVTPDDVRKAATQATASPDVQREIEKLKTDDNIRRLKNMKIMLADLQSLGYRPKAAEYLENIFGTTKGEIDIEKSEAKLKALQSLKRLTNETGQPGKSQTEVDDAIRRARTPLTGDALTFFHNFLSSTATSGNLPSELHGDPITNQPLLQAWFTDVKRMAVLPAIIQAEESIDPTKTETAEEKIKVILRSKSATDLSDFPKKVKESKTASGTAEDIIGKATNDVALENELQDTTKFDTIELVGLMAKYKAAKTAGNPTDTFIQQAVEKFKKLQLKESKGKSIDTVTKKHWPAPVPGSDEEKFIEELRRQATKS